MDGRSRSTEDELDSLSASSTSFWELGSYKKVVKLVDDGAKLSSELIKMAQERAELEAKYSKSLQQWSRKWEEFVNKGPEYGTLQNGWRSLLQEASRQSDIHAEISNEIKEIIKSISKWQAFHYHKSLGGRWKESKTAEEGFNSAQKPWAKVLTRCNKAKKTYHQVSSDLETVKNTLDDAHVTPIEMETLVKLREKKDKIEKEKEKAQEKYQSCLTEIFHDKDRYVRDMKAEYEKCLVIERIRMEFFKESLIKLKESVDLSKDERILRISQVCDNTLQQVSSVEDINWYSQQFGPDMNYSWPVYEEYEESRVESHKVPHLSSGSRSSSCSLNSPQRLSDANDHFDRSESPSRVGHPRVPLPEIPVDSFSNTDTQDLESSFENVIDDHIYESTDNWPNPSASTQSNEEEVKEERNERKRVLPKEGIVMRALFSYIGQDEDDLSFEEGDIIRFLEYCDGGWVKALLDEEYGYVPEAYFEPVI